MKHLLLLCSLLVCLPLHAQNDNSAPLTSLGSTLGIHGESYDWVEAADDGTYRTDSYMTADLNYTVSVVTKIGHPSLATVTGNSSWGAVDGHWSGTSYGDNYSESGTPGQGSWETWSYSVNLAVSRLDWTHSTASDDGSGNSSLFEEGSDGHWSQSSASNDGMGNTSWSESWGTGTVTEGTRAGGSAYWQTPPSGSVEVFGRTFTASSGDSSWRTETAPGVTTVNYASEQIGYTDADSSITIGTSSDTVSNTGTTWITGWTPEIGNFSATLPYAGVSDWNTVPWEERSDPSFAPDPLWINGWLVTLQRGVLRSDGTVEDVYEDASGLLEMTITGNVREVALGNDPAVVKINGANAGTVDQNQTFTLAGWTVSPSGPDQPSTEPYFLPGTSLWVDGVEFSFDEGLSDSNGNHVDTYAGPGGQGIVRLAGSIPGTAHVTGSLLTLFFHGVLAGETFTIAGAVVQVSALAPPPALPEALWVRGRYYVPGTTTGTYVWDPAGAAGSFTLNVVSVEGGYEITGTDDAGDLSGMLLAGGGMNFLYAGEDDSAPRNVPAIQASDNGMPLLSGQTLDPVQYPGIPLAVEVQGSILVFVGTLPSPSRAVYVPEDVSVGQRWLALRLDTLAVTLTDHATEPPAITTGLYDSTCRLFSTAHGAGSLPAYVHAVDDGNHAHWQLPLPDDCDLPPSFIVRGQPWWFAGWNDATNVAAYRGFYIGQVMTVDHAVQNPEGPPMDRLVTLVDPVFNAGLPNPQQPTQGTLSDVRRSVRLRDGTLVLSGNDLGGQQTVTYQDDYSLHTIRSDVDILGNSLSFGILTNDASLAGAAWRFEHRAQDGAAVLHSMLSRPEAEWVWWKAGALQAHELQPVMQLDTANRLNLYPPGGNYQSAPGITLDPTVGGTSTIRGVLRVRPGGDIDMGDFTAGGEP